VPSLAPDPVRVDLDRLWPIAEARVFELREALAQGGDRTRDALRALFGGGRLRVGPDPERGFRVDGWLALAIGGEESAREGVAPRASPRSSGGLIWPMGDSAATRFGRPSWTWAA